MNSITCNHLLGISAECVCDDKPTNHAPNFNLYGTVPIISIFVGAFRFYYAYASGLKECTLAAKVFWCVRAFFEICGFGMLLLLLADVPAIILRRCGYIHSNCQ